MDRRAVFDQLHEAFNRRDIDAVLAMMSDEVDCFWLIARTSAELAAGS